MDVHRLRLNDRVVHRLVAGVAVVGALLAFQAWRPGSRAPQAACEDAAHNAEVDVAVLICKRAYAETADPITGVRLANLLRRSHLLDEASALTRQQLATSAHANAVQVLGKIAIERHGAELGQDLLFLARVLHVIERDRRELAVDDQAIAGTFLARKQFAEALRALDNCISEARRAGDPVVEGYCQISAGQALTDVGYIDGAKQAFALAEPLLVHPGDRSWLLLKQAELEQRFGFGPLHLRHHQVAAALLESAIAYARIARQPGVVRSAELNLVASLAELGQVQAATEHLELARMLDVEQADVSERGLLEARIAYRSGDLARATALNTRFYDGLTDPDDQLRVCMMQARIGLDTGDLAGATRWASRGVEVAEVMRGALSAIELRPWLLSARRESHELLFTALVRAHRLDEALLAFDRWQGRTLLDAIARAKAAPSPNLRGAAMTTDEMQRLFPTLSNAPLTKPFERTALLAALRSVDLIALLVADDEIWRITARHGQLDMVDVGGIAKLRPRLDQLIATPTRIELADQLGVPLLGSEAFRATPETLFVLLDGELANLPVAALRDRGRWLVEQRTIVHASRLSELDCVPARPVTPHATVLANAQGNLPYAEHEAEVIARRLGVTPALGASATSAALFTASRDGVLHVAVHAGTALGIPSLALRDRHVSALEIAGRSAGPRLVFLAACGSASADDGELATSLATGFLASGSEQVIATLRSVGDAGAATITDSFYAGDGVADPARALAHVLAAAATSSNVDWPNFVLFGHDICRKESP
jgi:tetratricopeptide (TPR) repeat protein